MLLNQMHCEHQGCQDNNTKEKKIHAAANMDTGIQTEVIPDIDEQEYSTYYQQDVGKNNDISVFIFYLHIKAKIQIQ